MLSLRTKVTVVRINDPGLRAIREKLLPYKVQIGIFADEGAKDHPKHEGLTVLQVGIFNEFGLGVPQRSFLRAWFDTNQPFLQELATQCVRQAANAGDPEIALHTLGLVVAGKIQQRIAEGIEPPNAPQTIARKGSSTPLIDTGLLRASITSRVLKDGAPVPLEIG